MVFVQEITGKERQRLAPLFVEYRPEPVMADAVLQGHIGGAHVDNLTTPLCARLTLGPFALLGGSSEAAGSEELVADMPDTVEVVVASPAWWHLLRHHYLEAETEPRTSFSHQEFQSEKLKTMVGAVPQGVEVVQLDLPSAERMAQDMARDLLGVYESPEELMSVGTGFCALRRGRVSVSGHHSYCG